MSLLPWAASLAYSALWEQPASIAPVSAIVVLSGPSGPGLGIQGETEERVERGVELFKSGVAPILIMSGGAPNDPPAAARMRDLAKALGVEESRILVEGQARSTLQNAIFVSRQNPGLLDEPIVIVTHRYHLLRSRASFAWAGFKNVVAAAPDAPHLPLTRNALAEAIKWPVNILRGAVATLAYGAGLPNSFVDALLQ